MSDLPGIESRVTPNNQRPIVTDPPDQDCPHCRGRGVVGGCSPWRECNHTHTYSFCRCVNERTEEVPDDDR